MYLLIEGGRNPASLFYATLIDFIGWFCYGIKLILPKDDSWKKRF